MFWDVVIIIFSVSVVVGVILKAIIDKKKGKGGCCCDCTSCRSCPSCASCSSCKRETADEKN